MLLLGSLTRAARVLYRHFSVRICGCPSFGDLYSMILGVGFPRKTSIRS